MPFVQVNLWAGQTPETKKKIIQDITKVFTDLDIPPQAITIMINEIPLENWATAGQQHSQTSLKQP
jgi:4-oxalocrotonate tautomerase